MYEQAGDEELLWAVGGGSPEGEIFFQAHHTELRVTVSQT